MAYATVDDIQAEFRNIDFSDTTARVTTTKVEGFIDQSDSLINAYISKKYEVPVLVGGGLELLKMINIMLTSYRIKKILEVKSNSQADQKDAQDDTWKQAMKLLKDISTGDLVLEGADGSLVQSVRDYNSNNGIENFFKKDVDQW